METVANYPNLASAKVGWSLLKSSGIATLIPDEFLAGLDWRLITALKGIRLQVAPADVDQARWLLAQGSPVPELSAEDDDDREACPRCQSTLVGPPPWQRRLKAATFLFPPLVGLWPIFASASGNRTCFSCGLAWNHQ